MPGNELSPLRPTVETDSHDYRRDVQCLEDENRKLRRDLEDATTEKDRIARTVKNLQGTLAPFHRALNILFGEMELAVGTMSVSNFDAPPSTSTSGNDPRWESFKNRFPGVGARIIDALLIHGDMQVTHLATFVKAAKGTVYNAGDKLSAAGAITRAGGIWSLKR
jgi:hypothetical protein